MSGKLRSKMLTHEDGAPATTQHKSPCSDCPFRRDSVPGWLADMTPGEYLALAHSDEKVECHVLQTQQCAGLAIYRRNVAKKPRDPEVLILPANQRDVFGNPVEFIAHHQRGSNA